MKNLFISEEKIEKIDRVHLLIDFVQCRYCNIVYYQDYQEIVSLSC